MKSTISSATMIPVIPIPPILPVGYRFDPTDIQLIGYYLVMLLHGFYSGDMPIGLVNFWDLEPWELPDRSRVKSDEQVWYFFCKRVVYTDKKKRMFRRKTRAGHWKPTGESTSVEDLGKRTTLRFYKDSPKVEKTEWKAYEYEIKQSSILSNPDEFVIIKLMKSSGEKRTKIKTKMSKQKFEMPTSYVQNQNLDVVTTSDCCSHEIPADSGDQDVGNVTSMSTCSLPHQSDEMASECGDFPMRVSSQIPQNQDEDEQSNCLFYSDFENKNRHSEADSLPDATPHTENQPSPDETNPSCAMSFTIEELDLPLPEDDDFFSLMDLDVENEGTETFPEIDDGVLAELDALFDSIT